MTITNFDQLIEIFQQENVPFRADRDNQLIELAVHTGPLHTEMVVRWEAQLVLAQFIVAFPFRVAAERITAVEHALSILNHRLIMPGFGLDNDKGILYFRLVTPRQDDGSMTYDQINRLISAAVDTLLDFYPLLVSVVNEGKNADELLDALAPSLSKLPERDEAPAGAVAAEPVQAAAHADPAATHGEAAAAHAEVVETHAEAATTPAETAAHTQGSVTPTAAAKPGEAAAPHAEAATAPAEAPAKPVEVSAEPIEAAGSTTKATGATTQEPEAAAKAAEVTTEDPVAHPQTPAVAPQAAEAPAPTPGLSAEAPAADHPEKSPA